MWACWRELLLYLDVENKWLNEVESKLRATENIQEGTEEISEALDVSTDILVRNTQTFPIKSFYVKSKCNILQCVL